MSELTKGKKNKAAYSSSIDLLATANLLEESGENTATVHAVQDEDSTIISVTTAIDAVVPAQSTKSSSVGQTAPSALAAVVVPTPSKPDLAASSDTGTLNNDDITLDTTPSLTGTATGRATVTIMDGATVLSTTVASP